MSIDTLLRKPIRQLPVYEPGRPIEIVAREFGLDPSTVVKLASNENPLGPSPKALEAAAQALGDIWLYPENSAFFLKEKLAARLGVKPAQLIVGAGSNEIFYLLGHALVEPGVEVVMGQSAFITYKIMTLLHGGTPVEVPLVNLTHDLQAMRAAITERTRLVFLPNPNNPTGSWIEERDLLNFARDLPPQVVFCYDEAYTEYSENPPNLLPLVAEGRPVICARTFSKIYGLAGLRIGYGCGPAEWIAALEKIRPPFNTASVAQAAAMAALDDTEHVLKSRRSNTAGLLQLAGGLARLGLPTVPSRGNFMLVRFGSRASVVNRELQQHGIIVRPVAGYGLPEYLRVSVGTGAQNDRFLDTLEKLLPNLPSS